MSENYKISIAGKEKVVSAEELDTLLEADVTGAIVFVGKGADSIYQNPDGDIVNERLDAQQLRNRKAVGQQNILFGADDPKRQILRRDQQRREELEIAKGYGPLAFIRNFVPGIQFAENHYVGEEDATHFRQTLIGGNRWWNLAGGVGSFLGAGAALKVLGRGTALADVVGAHRASILGKTAQLAGESALLDTHLYAQHILNNNQDFVIEDWAGEVASGLVFASPIIGSFAGRAAFAKAGRWVLDSGVPGATGAVGKLASGLDTAAMLGVAKGLTETGAVAGKTMRRASIFRLGERLIRKVRTSKKAVGSAVDQIDEAIAVAEKELGEVKKFTPEGFKRLNIEGRAKAIQRFRDLSGEALEFLDDVDFANMGKTVREAHSGAAKVPKLVRNFNTSIRTPAKVAESVDEAIYNLRVEDAYARIETAGYGDIANYLENTLHLSSANESFGAWVRARFDMRLGQHAGTPGAVVADSVAREFIENADVWGKNAGRGKIINEAIDKIVDAGNRMDEISSHFPDKLDGINFKSVNELTEVDALLDTMRKGYKDLESQGVLTRQQVSKFETNLKGVQKSITKGKDQYFDAARLNKARRETEVFVEDRLNAAKAKMPKTPEEYQALVEQGAYEGAAMLSGLREFVKGSLGKGGSVSRFLEKVENSRGITGTRNTAFGVVALRRSTNQDEKRELYAGIRDMVYTLSGNPEAMAANIAELTNGLSSGNPVAGQLVQQRAAAVLLYLGSQLPRQNMAIGGNDLPEHISRINKFLDKALAVYEPISVGMMAAMGEVTPGMVEAVRQTNPAIYAEMYNIFAEELESLTPEERRLVPRGTLFGIETFIGGLNPSHYGYNLMQLQSTYSNTVSESQVINGNQPRTANTMRNPGPQDPGSDYTSTQRIAGY